MVGLTRPARMDGEMSITPSKSPILLQADDQVGIWAGQNLAAWLQHAELHAFRSPLEPVMIFVCEA